MNVNADFSKRAVAHAAAMPWTPSPVAGIDRRMLDRIGDEVARAPCSHRVLLLSFCGSTTHLWLMRSRNSGIRQMRQISVNCAEFVVVHLAERTPRHQSAIDLMTRRVDARAKRRDEFLKLPILYNGKAW